MTIQQFLQGVADEVSRRVASSDSGVKSKIAGSLLQIPAGGDRVHFEVWVQATRQRIELGLHFEGSRDTNDRLLTIFASEMIRLKADVASSVELEQWTELWGRVHTYIEYENLSPVLVNHTAECLARLMVETAPVLGGFRA